jgi:hypothetical protein
MRVSAASSHPIRSAIYERLFLAKGSLPRSLAGRAARFFAGRNR